MSYKLSDALNDLIKKTSSPGEKALVAYTLSRYSTPGSHRFVLETTDDAASIGKIDASKLLQATSSPSALDQMAMAIEAAYTSGKYERIINRKARTIKRKKGKTLSNTSFNSILVKINAQLYNKLKANMQAPRLVFRTGRLAASAKAVSVLRTKTGQVSIGYTYMRSPYGIFDRTTGTQPWATPERDPRSLIEFSIREIMKQYAIGQFFLRRV